MDSSPLLASVVVPAYNAGDTISACVHALQQQTIDRARYEVIVVDDGSSDATAGRAAEAGACVVQQPHRKSAAARNTGTRTARAEVVCFTDADCEPRSDWLASLLAGMADPSVAGIKGTYATRQRSLVARFVQLEYEDKYDLLRTKPTIDFIDTYSAAYRRDVLLANDGFDEGFQYVEDQELSFRLAARGYKMVFRPEAVVYHRHSATLASYLRKKFFIAYWKAQVVRRFPERGWRDSHTPQIMKVQMGLMALVLVSLVSLLLTLWSAVPLALLVAAFLLTTVRFTVKAWRKDRNVALVAPLLLAGRALALGFGYVWGTARPQPGVTGTQSTIGGVQYLAKRTVDVFGGLLGVLLMLALAPPIALAIKLDSPGPVFFRQQRIGQAGRPFTIVKFRSMAEGAEEMLAELLVLEELPEPVFKLTADPRRTRVGRFLRRWSLDELPQFWNVLRGDMSLVGPRPEEARIVAYYSDWHRRRLAIKPGVTGPMQVNGRGDLTLDERVRLELDYIDNYSFRRDLILLARTLPAVFHGEGAH
jgi:lipopolysaccharide/colanic/teichoic acid biosynthesis glycosyltransferase/glycosyltransferase involved in cell wall biosynthesis